jgi:hypothetical protein
MAARNFSGLKTLGRELIVIAGSFAPNGSSAVSATSRKGRGWSVARTDVGLFTITFTDKYVDLVSAIATAQLATAADIKAQIGTYTAASKTLVIRLLAVATETEVAADANNRVNFVCVFSNSSQAPVRG